MTSENAIVARYNDYFMVEAGHQHLQRPSMSRTFLVAYLLTGSATRAESAVLKAIASWGADRSESELFEQTIRAALQAEGEQGQPTGDDKAPKSARLAGELQAVLRLSSPLRHCYVLRVLVGMPRQACSRLLDLTMQCVDHYTYAALRGLPSLAASHSKQSR